MPLELFDPTRLKPQVYQSDDGDLWQTIGWITSPAAILENVKTGERRTEVIGCHNAKFYTRLVPKDGK